jgi:arsenate reductase
MTLPKGILFLCVANSARSQMAEGLARMKYGDKIPVQSAGSRPTLVNPYAIAVMSEVGYDLTTHTSKIVDTIARDSVDTVITLCGEEECPLFLGKAKRLHWGLTDPASEDPTLTEEDFLNRFRATRDAIAAKLDAFATEIGLT